MKKILAITLSVITLLSLVLGLTACSEESDVPKDMQLVRGSDELGYYFYGPDNWVIANDGEVACTYVTASNRTSMTFVEAPMPEGYTKPQIPTPDEIGEPNDGENTPTDSENAPTDSEAESTVPAWVSSYVAEQLSAYPREMKATAGEIKADDFGNAPEAYKVIYSYTFANASYKSMQMYVVANERFYIFTYTASCVESAWIGTPYDNYLEKAELAIKNAKFVKPTATATAPEGEPEDWRCASDKKLCYFNLYLPKEYSVLTSTSVVTAKDGEGRTVSASEVTWTSTGTEVFLYWEYLKSSLESVAEEVDFVTYKELQAAGEDVTEPESAKNYNIDEVIYTDTTSFVRDDGAKMYTTTYTYKMNGVTYKAITAVVRTTFKNFNITYAAEESIFDAGFEDAKEIFLRMEF